MAQRRLYLARHGEPRPGGDAMVAVWAESRLLFPEAHIGEHRDTLLVKERVELSGCCMSGHPLWPGTLSPVMAEGMNLVGRSKPRNPTK